MPMQNRPRSWHDVIVNSLAHYFSSATRPVGWLCVIVYFAGISLAVGYSAAQSGSTRNGGDAA